MRYDWHLWDGESDIDGMAPGDVRSTYGDGPVVIVTTDERPSHVESRPDGAAFSTVADAEAWAAGRVMALNQADADVAWARLRSERAPRLAEADIAINKALDTGADATALRAYRQALRDVTEGLTDPADVVWPTRPW